MRRSGVVVYKRVADEIAEEISSGRLEPGAQLPPEADLSARFAVNRHTLRRAIQALSDIGLVTVAHGRGTFVTEGGLTYQVGRRTRFTEVVTRQNRIPEAVMVREAVVPAEGRLASDLQVAEGTPCLVVETLHKVSNVPVTVASHYFVASRFPGLGERFQVAGSLSRALESFGIRDYVRKTTRVTARSATAEEARLLKQAPSKPVLVTETLNLDEEGTPLEHGVARSACDRLQIVFET